ncbi:hypothetical protein D3C76_830630 [compost metagenome]
MVHGKHQHMVFGADVQQQTTPQRAMAQIERPGDFCGHRSVDCRLIDGLFIELQRQLDMHHRARLLALLFEGGAQGFVANL